MVKHFRLVEVGPGGRLRATRCRGHLGDVLSVGRSRRYPNARLTSEFSHLRDRRAVGP